MPKNTGANLRFNALEYMKQISPDITEEQLIDHLTFKGLKSTQYFTNLNESEQQEVTKVISRLTISIKQRNKKTKQTRVIELLCLDYQYLGCLYFIFRLANPAQSSITSSAKFSFLFLNF
jgi:hypothetical protein